MSKKLLITLADTQYEALSILMKEDLITNHTSYIASLIGNEVKRRKEALNKPKAGRPKKEEDDIDPFDYSDDLPKNIPYFGETIGPREYAEKEEMRSHFQPKS